MKKEVRYLMEVKPTPEARVDSLPGPANLGVGRCSEINILQVARGKWEDGDGR